MTILNMPTAVRNAALGLSVAVVALTAVAGASHAKPSISFGLHIGGPYYGGGYWGGFGYPKRCYWLKRKAQKTGSYYWWSRYKKCRAYYY